MHGRSAGEPSRQQPELVVVDRQRRGGDHPLLALAERAGDRVVGDRRVTRDHHRAIAGDHLGDGVARFRSRHLGRIGSRREQGGDVVGANGQVVVDPVEQQSLVDPDHDEGHDHEDDRRRDGGQGRDAGPDRAEQPSASASPVLTHR